MLMYEFIAVYLLVLLIGLLWIFSSAYELANNADVAIFAPPEIDDEAHGAVGPGCPPPGARMRATSPLD